MKLKTASDLTTAVQMWNVSRSCSKDYKLDIYTQGKMQLLY